MRLAMYTFAALTALAPLSHADNQSDHDSLIGSWKLEGGAQSWVIRSIPNGLHVTQVERSATVADFDCKTTGDDCAVKIGGHKASVSMYYNGPALVEVETKGDQTVKRRFSIAPTGSAMKVEVTIMGAKVQTEEFEFVREAAAH